MDRESTLKTRNYKDQLGRTITLTGEPQRIISLVPSQTELLYDLGLGDRVVGITKFCVHPETWFRKKTRIGGTKNLDLEKIRSLEPDLIIGNKEENEKEQVEILEKEFPVWMSDIETLDEATDMIRSLGEITGRTKEGKKILDKIQEGFNTLENYLGKRRTEYGLPSTVNDLRTVYLIWEDPIMTAGKNTFINDMLTRCGLKNIFEAHPDRYPVPTLAELKKMDPELIILSSEPFPFSSRHKEFYEAEFQNAQVKLADGEMFSWYGSRLTLAPAYFIEFSS